MIAPVAHGHVQASTGIRQETHCHRKAGRLPAIRVCTHRAPRFGLGRPDVQEFLAIHDGRLPVRLPEWGRLEFIALLANPGRLIDRLFLSP
jgi:hypothetical protein